MNIPTEIFEFISKVMIPSTVTYTDKDGSKKVFLFHEELGHGGFAVVYRVTLQNSKQNYAMKVISKEKYTGPRGKNSLEKLKNEIQIQKSLNHPNIVQLKYFFSDDDNYYIVLEYCPGKSVRDYLKNSECGYLSEAETRKILTDVIQGLIYIQNNEVVHHDIKLENFIIGSKGEVKIADFGLSSYVQFGRGISVCGTTSYLSPELLQVGNRYQGFEVDIWALGVATFKMLTGKSPFDGGNKEITFENIRNCKYYFPSRIPLSYEAKDFIKTIFQIDPRHRATAIDLIDHPFLSNSSFDDDDEEVVLYKPPKALPKARKLPVAKKSAYTPVKSTYNLAPVRTNFRRSKSTASTYRPVPLYNFNDENAQKKFHFEDENRQVNLFNVRNTKSFNIPDNFVTTSYFRNDDLGYLFGDGTVGVCFEDMSRIVIDPNEEFVQYYKDYISGAEVINANSNNEKHSKKIAYVKKLARSFKKLKSLYSITKNYFDSSIPLHNVKYFVKKDNSVLFKFNDKDIQVNFGDNKKLIIFWEMKKMAIFTDIKEKCQLIDLNNISQMNPNCDIRVRFHNAKEMLNLLARKIESAH